MASSFFASTGLTICALVFLVLIIILVRSKLQPNSSESKIYIWNLYLTLILLVLELITSYTMSIRDQIPKLNDFLCEGYVFLSIIWEELFVIYTYFLLRTNKVVEKNKKFYWILSITIITCLLIPTLSVVLFEVSYYGGVSGLPYVIVDGPINILHLFSFVGAIVILLIFMLKKDKIKNLYMTPLLFAFVVFCLVFILQIILDFQINESVFMFSLIMVILYFTVESQDTKLMETIEKTKQEAEVANKAKTEFLMNISHQIRTPLNTILGFSESLLEDKNLSFERVKDDAISINMASNNLLNLINNILDISRIESDKEKIDEKEYLLQNVIYEINSYGPAKVNKSDVKFTILVDENIPANLYGDSAKICKIVTSVLSNAIEYTNYGEVKLEVKSNLIDNENCELIFHISNTGHAMKIENFQKDYYDFVKLDDESEASFDSTLLGLIVAKRLTDIMNGTMEFINETGKGTQYIIKIKQKVIGNNKLGNIFDSEKQQVTKQIEMKDCTGLKALIVDDNRVNIKIAKRLLERYNFQVDEANSGVECIELVKNNKYDIVFLDHMMPEMDGVETLNNLKHSGYKIPPVIALTANYYTGLKEEYLAQGFTDYLSKPIEFKELNQIINKVLNSNE